MAGRKPKPTALKKLEGNSGKRKLNTRRPYYERMDIVLVEFGQDYANCVIGDFRPAVVISRSHYNMYSPVMQVVPLTKKLKFIEGLKNIKHIMKC